MNGHISLYKDKFGKNWVIDLDNGTRENPGRNREGFSSWANAQRAAQVNALSWQIRFSDGVQRAQDEHRDHVQARIRQHQASAGVAA